MEISCFGESAYIKLKGWGTRRLSQLDGLSLKDACDTLGVEDYFVLRGGKVVHPEEALVGGSSYVVCQRIRGGKGGFGSMLRAIGAQIEKTTNREACRDLSGRRMRDVNNEKKMMEYLEKKAERERDREKKKKEKLERLTQAPKHFFNDPDYESKLHDVVENVDKALEKGLKSHSKKRKPEPKNGEHEGPEVKKGLWLGFHDASGSDSDSDDDMSDVIARTTPQRSGDSSGSEAGPSCSKDACSAESNEEILSNVTKGETATVSESAQSSNADQSREMPVESEEPPKVRTDVAVDTSVSGENNTAACDGAEDENVSDMKDASIIENTKAVDTDEAASREDTGNHDENTNDASTGVNEQSESSPPENEKTQDDEMDVTPNIKDQTEDTSAKNDENAIVNAAEDKTSSPDSDKAAGDAEDVKKKQPKEIADVDLSGCKTIEDLENLGLEALKLALMKKGVKCGGTLKERAVRLYNVKDLSPEQINPILLAKNAKKRSRSKK